MGKKPGGSERMIYYVILIVAFLIGFWLAGRDFKEKDADSRKDDLDTR